MPLTAKTFLVATLAITGIVPLSGFFSKDAILAGALFSHNPAWPAVGKIAYVLGTLAAAGTSFYMVAGLRADLRRHAPDQGRRARPRVRLDDDAPALDPGLPLGGGARPRACPPGSSAPATPSSSSSSTQPGLRPAPTRILGITGALGHLALRRGLGRGARPRLALLADVRRLAARLPRPVRGRLPRPSSGWWPTSSASTSSTTSSSSRPIEELAHGLWRIVDVFLIEGIFVNGVPQGGLRHRRRAARLAERQPPALRHRHRHRRRRRPLGRPRRGGALAMGTLLNVVLFLPLVGALVAAILPRGEGGAAQGLGALREPGWSPSSPRSGSGSASTRRAAPPEFQFETSVPWIAVAGHRLPRRARRRGAAARHAHDGARRPS